MFLCVLLIAYSSPSPSLCLPRSLPLHLFLSSSASPCPCSCPYLCLCICLCLSLSVSLFHSFSLFLCIIFGLSLYRMLSSFSSVLSLCMPVVLSASLSLYLCFPSSRSYTSPIFFQPSCLLFPNPHGFVLLFLSMSASGCIRVYMSRCSCVV